MPLPSLPSNAKYTFHNNRCFDWGTFGWVLSKSIVDASSYNYIVFMNSSVRGPFLPAYWPVSLIEQLMASLRVYCARDVAKLICACYGHAC